MSKRKEKRDVPWHLADRTERERQMRAIRPMTLVLGVEDDDPRDTYTFPEPAEVGVFSIDFRILGTGWALANVRAGREKHEVQTSFQADALGGLLSATLEALRQPLEELHDPRLSEPLIVPNRQTVPWLDPTTNWMWHVWIENKNQIRVCIDTGWEEDTDSLPPKKLLLNVIMPLDVWCSALIDTCESVLFRNGLMGYERAWARHRFPLSEYLWLRRVRAGRYRQRALGSVLSLRTDLDREIEMLVDLVKRGPASSRRAALANGRAKRRRSPITSARSHVRRRRG